MFTNHPHRQRGALKINTAQALIILIAVACVGVVFDAYQKSHDVPVAPSPSPIQDPKLATYADQMKQWQAELTQSDSTHGITLTWPYLGQDDVARVDLPKQQPTTLVPWDGVSIKKVTQDAYNGFVAARKKAKVANSQGCIVHVFLSTGQTDDEVAIGSASGAVPAQQE